MTHYQIELSKGEPLVVQTTLLDKVAFETYLRNNKSLGGISENSMRGLGFTTWNAARRAGTYTDSFEQFLEGTNPDEPSCVDIKVVEVTYADDLTEESEHSSLGESMPATAG